MLLLEIRKEMVAMGGKSLNVFVSVFCQTVSYKHCWALTISVFGAVIVWIFSMCALSINVTAHTSHGDVLVARSLSIVIAILLLIISWLIDLNIYTKKKVRADTLIDLVRRYGQLNSYKLSGEVVYVFCMFDQTVEITAEEAESFERYIRIERISFDWKVCSSVYLALFDSGPLDKIQFNFQINMVGSESIRSVLKQLIDKYPDGFDMLSGRLGVYISKWLTDNRPKIQRLYLTGFDEGEALSVCGEATQNLNSFLAESLPAIENYLMEECSPYKESPWRLESVCFVR